MDILFINPSNSKKVYQGLSSKFSAIEPPTWALLLAQACRAKGLNVGLLDTNALDISDEDVVKTCQEKKPKLICFVVYGQNVNAGTTSMSGAVRLSKFIKKNICETKIVFIGSHIQALPFETLKKEKSIDIGCTNEGVYAIINLGKLDGYNDANLKTIDGIIFRNSKKEIIINKPERIVPQDKMDEDLPGYAWDLLPYKSKPFDLYRSPSWHANYDEGKRSPYAALQTSLGCQFGCTFCMINIINRNDNDEIGVAGNYSKMRYWSPDFIIKEFDKLISMGVKTIRITDEMFLLNPKYYIPLCEKLKIRNKNDDLLLWSYSRVDTIKKPETLKLVREAGIRWLCLGIESGEKKVRLEISKGKFEDLDVKGVIKKVHEADIEVIANYIFGLPGDDMTSMEKTFNLSLELCTSAWNAYAAMALPGSKLYYDAIRNNISLPSSYEGYSFHSYESLPLPTEKLLPEQILKFRDDAFIKYHSDKRFLNRIKEKFGDHALQQIASMLEIKLERKILEKK